MYKFSELKKFINKPINPKIIMPNIKLVEALCFSLFVELIIF